MVLFCFFVSERRGADLRKKKKKAGGGGGEKKIHLDFFLARGFPPPLDRSIVSQSGFAFGVAVGAKPGTLDQSGHISHYASRVVSVGKPLDKSTVSHKGRWVIEILVLGRLVYS